MTLNHCGRDMETDDEINEQPDAAEIRRRLMVADEAEAQRIIQYMIDCPAEDWFEVGFAVDDDMNYPHRELIKKYRNDIFGSAAIAVADNDGLTRSPDDDEDMMDK